MDISVIIVNWNTKGLLEQCLRSIFKFSDEVSFEVIVVDNGSADGSGEMVRDKFPQVKLLLNKENLGFTKANNRGIKAAKGKYCFLLNSDTFLIENSLKKLVEKADSFNNLGALGPRLLNEDETIQQSIGFFPHLPQLIFWATFIDDLPFGGFLKPYHLDHNNFYKKERAVDWVTGAAILIPKTVIEKVGALDEKIFMYGEDVEFCFRIKRANLQVYFSPSTQIVHIKGGSHNRVHTPAFIGEYMGLTYFYKKYKGTFALQILKILLRFGALVRIIIFTIVGRKELAKAYGEVIKVA